MVEAVTPYGAPNSGPDGGAGNANDGKPQAKKGARRNRHRAPVKQQQAHVAKEKFSGRSDDLQGFIYDVAVSKGGVAYTKTTEEIARHVGEKYTTVGSYIRTAVLTIVVPMPTQPTPPATTGTPPVADQVEMAIFNEKIRMYVKAEAAIEASMKSLYDLIWGQCSDELQATVRLHDKFEEKSNEFDGVWLLKRVEEHVAGLSRTRNAAVQLREKMMIFLVQGSMR